MAVGTQRDVRSKYETLLTIKEIATMKKFEVEMDIHFTKTVHIEAPNEDAAITFCNEGVSMKLSACARFTS